jgi:hypothetical protein
MNWQNPETSQLLFLVIKLTNKLSLVASSVHQLLAARAHWMYLSTQICTSLLNNSISSEALTDINDIIAIYLFIKVFIILAYWAPYILTHTEISVLLLQYFTCLGLSLIYLKCGYLVVTNIAWSEA